MKVTHTSNQTFQPIEMSITLESMKELAVFYAIAKQAAPTVLASQNVLRALPEITTEDIGAFQSPLYDELNTICDNLGIKRI